MGSIILFNKKVILLIFLIFLSLSAVSANSTDDSLSIGLVDNDNSVVVSQSDEGNFTQLSGLIDDVSQNVIGIN